MKKLLAAMLLVVMVVVTGCAEKKPAPKTGDKATTPPNTPANPPK